MLDTLKTSKAMFLAALLMFAGATFQITDDHWIAAAVCFAAATSFMAASFASVRRVTAHRQSEASRKTPVLKGRQ